MKVLVMEPPNQQLPIDTARPNGSLGPAYLVGALRAAGVEADYYDGTVGWEGDDLKDTFYNRVEQENGLVRYGASKERLAEVISKYDVIATSSIFSAQTRMHFEIADIVKRVEKERGKRILLMSGGVNACALRNLFLHRGFNSVTCGGNGEIEIVSSLISANWVYHPELDVLALPALDALPLKTYQTLGIPHAGVMPKGTKFASIQTSRGCQDRCSFCHISTEKEHGYGFLRSFSPARIKEYVDYAISLGIQRLYFEDDNLFFNKRRLYELAPILKRDGLEYSNVNGGNLRFLFKNGEVDHDFINMLRDFGLAELVLPFESRSSRIMKQYATGKYDPDIMDSKALVRALKDAGIRLAGNFMIGFKDEPWESILQTKEFAKELMQEGLDAVGFMIPVPYPGSLDFQNLMQDQALKESFNLNPLAFTDRMHWRAKPLFPTVVDGDRLHATVEEFWHELNSNEYVQHHIGRNTGHERAKYTQV